MDLPARAVFSPRLESVIVGALLAAAVAGSCGPSEEEHLSSCSFTYECSIGEICRAGCCVSALDGGEGGTADGGGAGEGGGGAGGAEGQGGEGGEGAPASSERIAFAPNDYRRCFDSLECSVFGGDCLIELPLSRPLPDGTDRIKLSDLDRTLEEGQGICGAPCTNEPRICESMVVSGPEGQSRPSTCQVIYAGPSPYPTATLAFPFDDLLDVAAMDRGVPYASICRPPFEHAPAHSPEHCRPCTEAAQCGEGDGCWLERAYAPTPSGSCVQRCVLQKDCPFGFRCTDLEADDPLLEGEAGAYCLPIAGTCGRCLDQDGDQRGVGSCGPLDEPITSVDCDDANPDAYFDPNRMRHPFPRHCGDFDFNCNGLSDRVEQLGSEAHCAACGDRCAGPVPNGVRSCREDDDAFGCRALCAPGFADCNGLVEDGCETELAEGMIWARDRDGDGRGDPAELRYFCEGAAPAGWVQNTFDCDDADPLRFGGGVDLAGQTIEPAYEVCDGIDNDCSGVADDGLVVVLDDEGSSVGAEGDDCTSAALGVCAPGHLVCEAAIPDVRPAKMRCVSNLDPVAQGQVPEQCNGLDDDCDGDVDEDVDYFFDRGEENPLGRGAPAACTIPDAEGICAQGVWTCRGDAGAEPWVCVAPDPKERDPIGDGVDENCDGIDGELQGSIFVRHRSGGGTLDGFDPNPGTAQAPVATLQRALALACAVPGDQSCRDIYMEAGTFRSGQQVTIPVWSYEGEHPKVRIYGGFTAVVRCEGGACAIEWSRELGGARTTIVREAPAPSSSKSFPFGSKYAAIAGAAAGAPMQLLLDQVDVRVLSPDLSHVMEPGASAPAQIGIECPPQGCSRLHLREATVQIADALHGAAGAQGEVGRIPAEGNEGIAGCIEGENCRGPSGGFDVWGRGDNFMNFGFCGGTGGNTIAPNAWSGWVREAALCADGQRPSGGSPGGVRCGNPSKSNSTYLWTAGRWGSYGGYGGYAGRGGDGGGFNAGRGGDGWLGTAGMYYLGAGSPLYYDKGPVRNVVYQSATDGHSGGGGGGSGGCLNFKKSGNWYGCNSNHRGGGGGAGGCNGTAGGRGGNGGSAIGLVLIPPASGTLELVTPGDRFQVISGRGGNGGDGGAGGAGAPGGWGGLGRTSTEELRFAGGEGGDGGGGGGGGGGHGGVSIGIWQVCTRGDGTQANGCSMKLPPLLTASPSYFVELGEAGQGGKGGDGGKRGEKAVHAFQRADIGADPAVAPRGHRGFDGEQHHLLFSRNRP